MRTDAEVREAFLAACKKVVHVAGPTGERLPYASAYAGAAIRELARGKLTADEEQSFITAQALYILGNLRHWRGDEARATRAIFERCTTGK